MRGMRLSAGVDDVATGNLASDHEVIDGLELTEADSLEGDLDEATLVEVNGLGGIGTVTDVGALDGDHADDSVEDGSREVGVGGETNAHHNTARADVLGSLLEGLLADGDEEDSVRAEAVAGGGLNLRDEVGRGGEVNIGGGTELLAKLALLLTTIDGNGVDAHGLGILKSDGAETTTGTDNGNGLAGLDTGLLEALVDGDTGAQDRGDGLEVTLLGDAGNVSSLGDSVLLERAIDGVTGKESLGAERLVGLLAVSAAQARAVEPLNADMVADLNILNKLATGDDDTSTLVTTDKGQLDIEGPVTHHGVVVGVADTGELDVNEDLIGTGLLDGNLLVLGGCKREDVSYHVV